MKYLAITQETANWLFNFPPILSAVHHSLAGSNEHIALKTGEVAIGPLRIAGTPDGRVIAIWNVDYLSGTGEEDWGFVKMDDPMGLTQFPKVSREVLERSLYVIDHRLRGLIIDSTYYHHAYANGAHTCLAGRGEEARQLSIGYLESDIRLGNSSLKTVACLGPSREIGELSSAAAGQKSYLANLVASANSLINENRRRPLLDENTYASIRAALKNVFGAAPDVELGVTVPTAVPREIADVYRTLTWSYDEWISPVSPLSPIQRRILESDAVLKHPMRIVGPGGSGKSLLMQLLAIRRLRAVEEKNEPVRVLYVVHNSAMVRNMNDRFEQLGAKKYQTESSNQSLHVQTLAEYGRAQIELQETAVIDADAHQTKLFQLEQVKDALKRALTKHLDTLASSNLLTQVANDQVVFDVFARLVMVEISTAIKGHGLVHSPQKYIGSERHLSRLHGLMTQNERTVVFDAFLEYHTAVFEQFQVLDSDDIALSLLGRLRTPIWELKRKTLGYDFVFVDETQLFNENERRLFPLLTKGTSPHVPIVLALDEAQEIYGQTTAGLGALGIKAITNESLPSNHRSTKSIVDLAFFVIQRTTDLFGPDFPDFKGIVTTLEPEDPTLVSPPHLEVGSADTRNLGRLALKRIREFRKANLRQIAVICHADLYWNDLVKELSGAQGIHLQVLLQRGEKIPSDEPAVVLSRPAYVGGQEFDAVIVVGLEQGVVPPRIHDNAALASAVEQQAYREMYISFTRARYQLEILVSHGSSPSGVLQEAKQAGLIR